MIVDKVASVKLEFIKDLKDVSVYKTDSNFVFILNGVGEDIEVFYNPNRNDLPYRTTEGVFLFRAHKIYDSMFDDIPMDMHLDVFSEVTTYTATMIASLEANDDFLNEIDDKDFDNLMKEFDYE